MKKILWIIIIVGAFVLIYFGLEPREVNKGKSELIKVTFPLPNEEIESPVLVSGEARGFWFFEASFPVRLLDGNGKEIAVEPAQTQGEWMTEDFVPFELELEFPTPETPAGTLVLEKDNPL